MNISFEDLKEKEIVNVFDGKKLGHIIDILFDGASGVVQGVFVPGEKRFFKRGEDIFVPLEKIKKIGDDVILVKLQMLGDDLGMSRMGSNLNGSYMMNNSYNNYGVARGVGQQRLQSEGNNSGVRGFQNKGLNNQSFVRFRPINKIKYK